MTYRIRQANDGCRDCGAFFLDVVGEFRRQDVTIKLSPARRATTAEIEQAIDQAWVRESALAAACGHKLYDGWLYRLIECDVQDKRMELTVGEVTYREFLGTNVVNSHIRYNHGMEAMANPLGVSAAVISGDGFIVLGRRSQEVTIHKGMIHPLGGMVESPESINSIGPAGLPGRRCSKPGNGGELPDLFAVMIQELGEEAALADKVSNILLLGLVRDKQLNQPEFIFDVAVDADVREIHRLAESAADAGEHSELLAVPDKPTSIVDFIEQHRKETTPVAIATLLLHGLHHWGSGWFASACGYLRDLI